jgi:tetratricopeptide (TPR) repeat protein
MTFEDLHGRGKGTDRASRVQPELRREVAWTAAWLYRQAVDDARTWLPRCLAMAAFMLYVMAAPPGFFWLDSAELSAAAVAMGVPHPTGFPLYCIVARAASLVPVGELAFRIELVSAVCAALAVFWVTRLVLELCRGDGHALVGATVAGTLLALSAVFLRQATVAEVYAPSAALLAGGLLLLERVSRGADARWGLALALVCGLALALHVSAWLIGPVAVALMGVRLYRGARWPLLAPLVALAMAGAASAYLPVRSAGGGAPVLDWGHPDRASTLLGHLSAQRIRSAFDDEIGALEQERLAPRIEALIDDVADHVGPIAPLAALLGLVWLARQRRSRWPAAALIVIGAGDLLYALWVNPMGQTDWQNGVPLALSVSAGAGAGVAWLSRFLRSAGPFVGAVAGVLLVVPPALVSVPAVWPASAPGGSAGLEDAPRAWAEAALAATPPRGLALVQYDSTAAGLLYLTEVEHARPDVAVLVRQFLVDPEYVRAALARGGVDSRELDRVPGRGLDPAATLGWILGQGRPVAWELGRDGVPAGMDVRNGAPLARLVPATGAVDRASERVAIAAAAQALARIFAGAGGLDRIARREHARALTALGRSAYGLGDLGLAVEILQRALVVRPSHVPALVNLGVVAAHAGDFDAAVQYTERAVTLAPAHVVARVNVTRYLMQLDQDRRAEEHIEHALRLDPRHAAAWALAATLDMRADRRERGLQRLGRALALDPRDADALALRGQLDPALVPASGARLHPQ